MNTNMINIVNSECGFGGIFGEVQCCSNWGAELGHNSDFHAATGENNSKMGSRINSFSLPSVILRLINNIVYVEGGTFMMVATSWQDSDALDTEEPAHQVTLSSFHIGKFQVTQGEWKTLMGTNPSETMGVKFPVDNVSWYDCQEFIRKLNAMTGKGFRFPTEAEWEYAARGGRLSRGYTYAGSNNADDVAWYIDSLDDNSGIHEVGLKLANELGLYDMSGNVSDWCSDYTNVQTNPIGASSDIKHIIRGGCYYFNEEDFRVSERVRFNPTYRCPGIGLRLAL